MSIRDTVKTPVAVLKVGESRQCRLDLEFPDYPVTFTLIQGSGPVHLHVSHLSSRHHKFSEVFLYYLH